MTAPARFQLFSDDSLVATGAFFPRTDSTQIVIVGAGPDDWAVTAPNLTDALDQVDADVSVTWLDDTSA
jgi:hypothetical protein